MDEEINIELDSHMTNYYKDRSEYMRSLQIPTITVAKDTLKTHLVQIVFDECEDALKVNFGLEPPLRGLTGDMWNSPSDLLRGKVVLVPPLTRTYIQSLTHQGILKIGREIEQKFLYEQELEKQNALALQKKQLTDAFEDILKEEIKDVETRERAACHREMERMTTEFEATLIEALNDLEQRLGDEYAAMLLEQERVLEQKWKEIMEEEIEKTIKMMTVDFLRRLDLQEEVLKKEFSLELRKAETKRQYDLGLAKATHKLNMNELRHELECKNLANMMYIICMERRKCFAEKTDVENYYLQEMDKLNKNFQEKEQKVRELLKNLNQKRKEIELRETCILEIIKQFQKFINYALKSAPTQAEFLLSVEKMMVFELTHAILRSNIKVPEPCDGNLKWMSPKQYVIPEAPSSLELEDYHKCFHEIIPQKSNEFLPSFYYKDKLYIREDFRNMLTHGITITPSNELWNEDVEILMESLKEIVQPIPEEKKEEAVSTGTELKSKCSKIETRKSQLLEGGSVRKVSIGAGSFNFRNNQRKETKRSQLLEGVSNRKVSIGTGSLNSKNNQPRGAILKPVEVELADKVNFKEVLQSDSASINLLGARNSLEVIRSRMSLRKSQQIELVNAAFKETIKECEEKVLHQDKEKDASTITEQNREDVIKQIDNIIVASVDQLRIRKSSGKPEVIKEEDTSATTATSPGALLVDLRDSLLLRKSHLAKEESPDFNILPTDSLDLTMELKNKLRQVSKIAHTKSSVEMLRESMSAIKGPMPPCARKDRERDKERLSVTSKTSKDICCLKCYKQKSSVEVVDGLIGKREKMSESKPIQVSHIEVIKVEPSEQRRTSVVVNTQATEISRTPETDIEDISKLYKTKKKIVKAKPKPIKLPPAKIVGDPNAKEHLQDVHEFTTERIQSLVSIIKDHPNLIRMFTPCTR